MNTSEELFNVSTKAHAEMTSVHHVSAWLSTRWKLTQMHQFELRMTLKIREMGQWAQPLHPLSVCLYHSRR